MQQKIKLNKNLNNCITKVITLITKSVLKGPNRAEKLNKIQILNKILYMQSILFMTSFLMKSLIKALILGI